MLEMHLNVGRKGSEVTFVGELSNEQFTTYANVSSLSGVSVGTLHNEGSGWLSFDYEGKELIVSKKTVRYSISWNQINAVGCVYGNKIIKINGNQYKVRLLKGTDEDPTSIVSGAAQYVDGTHNSEWSRLFYPLVRDDVSLPSDIRNLNAPYTNLDIGLYSGLGRRSWCQEIYSSNPVNRVCRGFNGVSGFERVGNTSTSDFLGWRPCLELIQSHEAPEIQVASYHNPEDFEMAPSNLHHTYHSDPNTL